MTLDTYRSNVVPTGVFADNSAHLIEALDLRAFATDIATALDTLTANIPTTPPLVPKGAYNGATLYHPNEVVTYNGSAYYLGGVSNVTGVLPTGGAWVLLVSKGADGGAVTFGTTAGTAAEGNDARLSDQRVPTALSVTDAKVAVGAAIAPSKIAGTAVVTADSRLSDQRVPTNSSVTDAKIATTLSPSKITGVAVTGVVDNSKMATMSPGTVKGNPNFDPGAPLDVAMVDLAGMLAGIIKASQVGVDVSGGAVGPSVQTALQDVVTKVNTVLRFT